MEALKWVGWVLAVAGAGLAITGIVLHGHGSVTLATLLSVGIGTLLMGLTFIGSSAIAVEQERVKAQVLATGLAGTATIVDVKPTGISFNDEPQCKITVNVSLPERLIYQATIKEVISPARLARYKVDAVFPCRVKPHDLSRVVLIFGVSQLGGAGSGRFSSYRGGFPGS